MFSAPSRWDKYLSNPDLLLGRRVLILGEVGTGKTSLTAKLLDALLEAHPGYEGTLIEMAPTALKHMARPLRAYSLRAGRLRLLEAGPLRAPRLEGRDAGEVLSLARNNALALSPLLLQFLMAPTPLLVIDDLSIYLQAGEPSLLERAAMAARTFLGNAYYGSSLSDDKGSGISARERRAVEQLSSRMDDVILLTAPPGDRPRSPP